MNARFCAVLAALLATTTFAATSDDYLTCGLIYGGLFKAVKDSRNDSMIPYTRPRLQAVISFLQDNRNDPEMSERMKVIAAQNRGEVDAMVKQSTAAMIDSDAAKLKKSLAPVFKCDVVFEIPSFPLPLTSK